MKEHIPKQYFKLGVTIVTSGVALIVFKFAIDNMAGINNALSTMIYIISPFIYGAAIAYILSPLYNGCVRNLYKLMSKKSNRKALRIARTLSTIICLAFLAIVVVALGFLIIPETVKSVIHLLDVMPQKLGSVVNWIEGMTMSEAHPEIARMIEGSVQNLNKTITSWTTTQVMPKLGEYMAQISMGVLVTLKTIFNLLIGVIVCVYILNSKELFKAQCRKVIKANFSESHQREILDFVRYADKTFGGFINGKLIDSLIMGVLCFICMSIINLPYSILVSTIVGVTNFIPFFGPFIGAIPSALIICVESPIQAGYFILLIVVLQQVDGNIIGPKILGETTGLASFWVMFAILVGGGLFGFIGMILGVPLFAIIYYYVRRRLNNKLKKKELPFKTEEYIEYDKYDIEREDIFNGDY